MKHYLSKSINETNNIGFEIAKTIKPGFAINIVGNLGSGKTALCASIIKNLGVTATVTSPTYPILNEYYTNSLSIFHFDFYRLQSYREFYDSGFEEKFNKNSICFVEWNSKIEEVGIKFNIIIEMIFLKNNERNIYIKINN